MRKSRLSIFGVALSAVLLLSACDMTTPSQVETGHIRLQENVKSVTVNPAKTDARQVAYIADDYKRLSRGKMTMVIPYKKGSPAEEVKAHRQGRDWQQNFAKAGVQGMDVNYVGVEDPQFLSRAVISYPALQALAPEGCRRLTGVHGADSLEDVHEYRMGCETKSSTPKTCWGVTIPKKPMHAVRVLLLKAIFPAHRTNHWKVAVRVMWAENKV